jgi:hypothetical protein
MTQTNKSKTPIQIFLSYTMADIAYARKIRALLSQRLNLRIFTTETLSAGEDWKTKIRDEIAQCDIFVVLLSPDAVTSPWVLNELGAAWGLQKPIISIVTQPDVFAHLPILLDRIINIEDVEKPGTITQILEHYEGHAAATATSE